MTNPKHTDTSRSGEPVAWMVTATTMESHRRSVLLTEPDPEIWDTITPLYPADRIEALEAENERLREVLEVVWKEATTMRNASKLVGPYPKDPANNRVWARSMYHAGKKLHELIKPIRAALGEKQ